MEVDSASDSTEESCCVFVVAVADYVVLETDFVCVGRDFSGGAREFFGGLTYCGEATLTSFCMMIVAVETANVICVA